MGFTYALPYPRTFLRMGTLTYYCLLHAAVTNICIYVCVCPCVAICSIRPRFPHLWSNISVCPPRICNCAPFNSLFFQHDQVYLHLLRHQLRLISSIHIGSSCSADLLSLRKRGCNSHHELYDRQPRRVDLSFCSDALSKSEEQEWQWREVSNIPSAWRKQYNNGVHPKPETLEDLNMTVRNIWAWWWGFVLIYHTNSITSSPYNEVDSHSDTLFRLTSNVSRNHR